VLCSGLIVGRGVLVILVFVAVIAGTPSACPSPSGERVHYPATWARLTGGLVMD